MKKFLYFLLLLFPWKLRRLLLQAFFGYQIHPTARIGYSLIMPKRLVMGPKARIGHLTMCKGLELLEMGESARIGNGNWISGFLLSEKRHFTHQQDSRRPILRVGDHSAITHRHLIDCTNAVEIGRFVTFAGYASQVLTHSIDLAAGRQSSKPVRIGDYCFVGTAVVILGGSVLPDYSVLGAKALLNKAQEEEGALYAGVPARLVQKLDRNGAYFTRETGFVV